MRRLARKQTLWPLRNVSIQISLRFRVMIPETENPQTLRRVHNVGFLAGQLNYAELLRTFLSVMFTN